jgi:hypothetical protein
MVSPKVLSSSQTTSASGKPSSSMPRKRRRKTQLLSIYYEASPTYPTTMYLARMLMFTWRRLYVGHHHPSPIQPMDPWVG